VADSDCRGKILVASMGGTIATLPDADGLRVSKLTAADIVGSLPGTGHFPPIVTRDVSVMSSRAITPSHMLDLAQVIRDSLRGRCRGVVVMHGTDTMEETAYALDLMVPRECPLILTGAIRPPDQPGADGMANLYAALTAAAEPALAQYGPVIVFADEIHLARLASKAHTSRTAAFRSLGAGPIGWITERRVHLLTGPPAPEYLGRPATLNARVELILVVAGSDDALLRAAARISQGIVLAGTGGGHVTPSMVEAVQDALDAGVTVVLASRTGSGPVLSGTYGGPGSETDLLKRGVISAGTLQPIKARLRLMVGLSLGLAARDLFPASTTHAPLMPR
jgi:L-asparaginase